ncbi:unnamed protein product [Amoebophrya sp. A120]|nr:unnamed protein product [Amoebophrya sp. A120]|eukprot:GSA120T00006474001.1
MFWRLHQELQDGGLSPPRGCVDLDEELAQDAALAPGGGPVYGNSRRWSKRAFFRSKGDCQTLDHDARTMIICEIIRNCKQHLGRERDPRTSALPLGVHVGWVRVVLSFWVLIGVILSLVPSAAGWLVEFDRIASWNDTSFQTQTCSAKLFLDRSDLVDATQHIPSTCFAAPPASTTSAEDQVVGGEMTTVLEEGGGDFSTRRGAPATGSSWSPGASSSAERAMDAKLHRLYDLACQNCAYFMQSEVILGQNHDTTTGDQPLDVERLEKYELRPTLQGCQFHDEMASLARELFPELGKMLGISVTIVTPLHLASDSDLLHPSNRMYYKAATFSSHAQRVPPDLVVPERRRASPTGGRALGTRTSSLHFEPEQDVEARRAPVGAPADISPGSSSTPQEPSRNHPGSGGGMGISDFLHDDRAFQEELIARLGRLNFCEVSFFAVWALVAQWYVVRISASYLAQEYAFLDSGHVFENLRHYTQTGFSLAQPWPISHRMIPLHMNFYAFTRGGCCVPSQCAQSQDRLVLRVKTHSRCGMQFTDKTLVNLCRARYSDMKTETTSSSSAMTTTHGLKPVVLSSPEFPPSCPPASFGGTGGERTSRSEQSAAEDDKSGATAVVDGAPARKDGIGEENKYLFRVRRNQCSYESGLWAEPMADRFKCMMTTIGIRQQFQPGDTVFDWGSGCGHMLTWFAKYFGIRGFGIEILEPAVQFSQAFGVGSYCQADGNRGLSWIPNESFDHVVSCGALIHAAQPCAQLQELLLKVKVGGTAWLGCMPLLEDRKNLKQDEGQVDKKEDGEDVVPHHAASASSKKNVDASDVHHHRGGHQSATRSGATYAVSQLTRAEWIQCVRDVKPFPDQTEDAELSREDEGSVARRTSPRTEDFFSVMAVQDHILFDSDSEMYALEFSYVKEPNWFSMTSEHFSLLIKRQA